MMQTLQGTVSARRTWLLFALATTVLFGIWGALIEIPEKAGFPATLGYSVWALTMMPCAAVALGIAGWHLEWDRRSVLLGSTAGLLGAGGQLLLFEALRLGPAYLVFPIISLYPMLTVLLSATLLRESATRRTWTGILLAAPALVLLSYQPPSSAAAAGAQWLILCLLVLAMWGIQGYLMKFANRTMRAESIFFYMAATAAVLIPAALAMTEFNRAINWGWSGAQSAAAIQFLNAVGALCLVYALRYGKAIIVAPMTAMAPVLTIVISLLIYHTVPGPVLVTGMVLAAMAIYLMAE